MNYVLKQGLPLMITIPSRIPYLIIFFLSGCSCLNKPNEKLFEIETNLNFQCVLESGYEYIPEDVLILQKKVNDTLCYFQFNDTLSPPAYKYWLVRLRNNEWKHVSNLLKPYNVSILSYNDSINQFSIQNLSTKEVFKGEIISDTTLLITYDYASSP